jgi:cytochrome c oxidase subunit 4
MHTKAAKHTPHVLPLKVYLGVGGALLCLTALTISASFVHFGPWNMVVALAIASIKALLVAFFFMHLYYDNKLYFLAFTVGLLCLTVFIVLTMFDTMERGAIYEIKQGQIHTRAAMYDSMKVTTEEGEGKAEEAPRPAIAAGAKMPGDTTHTNQPQSGQAMTPTDTTHKASNDSATPKTSSGK